MSSKTNALKWIAEHASKNGIRMKRDKAQKPKKIVGENGLRSMHQILTIILSSLHSIIDVKWRKIYSVKTISH